jgi:hypothetical protein
MQHHPDSKMRMDNSDPNNEFMYQVPIGTNPPKASSSVAIE